MPYIFILTCVISAMTVSAQNFKHAVGLSIGPAATSNVYYSNFYRKNKAQGAKAGLVIDLAYQLTFSKKAAFKTGLVYEEKGTSALNIPFCTIGDVIVYDYFGEYKFDLKYLTIPALVQYGFGTNVKFNLNGGLYTSFLLNQNSAAKNWTYNDTFTKENDRIKSYDWGVMGGLGLEFPVGNSISIPIDLRGSYGLNNISEFPEGTRFEKMKNLSVGFSAGIKFYFN